MESDIWHHAGHSINITCKGGRNHIHEMLVQQHLEMTLSLRSRYNISFQTVTSGIMPHISLQLTLCIARLFSLTDRSYKGYKAQKWTCQIAF